MGETSCLSSSQPLWHGLTYTFYGIGIVITDLHIHFFFDHKKGTVKKLVIV